MVVTQVQANGIRRELGVYKAGTVTFSGDAKLTFGLPDETFDLAPGATTVAGNLVDFTPCGTGTKLNFQTNVCEGCPQGKLLMETTTDIRCVCGEGTYNDGGACKNCPAGFYSLADAKKCVPCALGQYSSVK